MRLKISFVGNSRFVNIISIYLRILISNVIPTSDDFVSFNTYTPDGNH